MIGTLIVAAGVGLAGLAPAARAQGPAQPGASSEAEMRELVEAAKATAKATRDMADSSRVTPDILTQILTKLDKLEDKLDKIENALKQRERRR
jgi:hypothetical protein